MFRKLIWSCRREASVVGRGELFELAQISNHDALGCPGHQLDSIESGHDPDRGLYRDANHVRQVLTREPHVKMEAIRLTDTSPRGQVRQQGGHSLPGSVQRQEFRT